MPKKDFLYDTLAVCMYYFNKLGWTKNVHTKYINSMLSDPMTKSSLEGWVKRNWKPILDEIQVINREVGFVRWKQLLDYDSPTVKERHAVLKKRFDDAWRHRPSEVQTPKKQSRSKRV